MKTIDEIKSKVIEFFSDSNNYASYGDELKSTDGLFAFVYDEAPQRTYVMLFDEEKGFYFTPYFNHKVTKRFPDGEKAEFDTFMAKLLGQFKANDINHISCTLKNDCTFLFLERGYVLISTDSSTGNIKKFSIHPLEDNEETISFMGNLIISCIVTKKDEEMKKNHYKIAYVDEGEIDTLESEFDDWTTNIKLNYNDDVPYTELNEEIKENKSSLIMLYGEPGTGKSSLIKSLVNDNLDKEFIYIDPSLLTSISNGQFLTFLNEHRGSIFILEDCEKALADRKTSSNEAINTILNITDGIVAESLKCKFICTFNCALEDIDKALLRKGRLSILYEFKKLTLDKAKVIYPEATGEMTLADAHNATKKVDFTSKPQRKIGF
jgi:hypothetical protein